MFLLRRLSCLKAQDEMRLDLSFVLQTAMTKVEILRSSGNSKLDLFSKAMGSDEHQSTL
jgi:hypothetical protein